MKTFVLAHVSGNSGFAIKIRQGSVGVVLIGDAAGSLEPTQGHGTSHLIRDIRVLSELLLCGSDWQAAIEEYASGRRQTYDVLRAFDRWMVALRPDSSSEAERLREGHVRAIDADPSLAGEYRHRADRMGWSLTRRPGGGFSGKP